MKLKQALLLGLTTAAFAITSFAANQTSDATSATQLATAAEAEIPAAEPTEAPIDKLLPQKGSKKANKQEKTEQVTPDEANTANSLLPDNA